MKSRGHVDTSGQQLPSSPHTRARRSREQGDVSTSGHVTTLVEAECLTSHRETRGKRAADGPQIG